MIKQFIWLIVRSTSEHSGLVETFPPLHCAAGFPRCDYFSAVVLCKLLSASSDWPHFLLRFCESDHWSARRFQSRIQFSHSYGFVRKVRIFVRIFSKITIFGFLYGLFFYRDHFYGFYSLILLFCKLCECDAICCELCDDKYQNNLVSILSIV